MLTIVIPKPSDSERLKVKTGKTVTRLGINWTRELVSTDEDSLNNEEKTFELPPNVGQLNKLYGWILKEIFTETSQQ